MNRNETTPASIHPADASRPRAAAKPMRHVALLIESSGAYGRGILQGIAKYNRAHGAWSTFFRPHGMSDPPPSWLRDWKGDGMLVRIDTREMANLALKSGVPVVNLRGTFLDLPFPHVTVDNHAVGRLAAQHLIDRGLRNFGMYSRPHGENRTLDDRCDGFRKLVESHKYACEALTVVRGGRKIGWEDEQDRLAGWLSSLPKPVGVMASNDELGLQVLDACRRCGAQVPDDIAVIGVDNDESLCELSIPPLTSIDVNAEGVGYEAAALLDRMMTGRKPSSSDGKPLILTPRGVVTRRSTDIIASEDEEVARAARYIREHACRGLQVVDVLSHVGMSRASLQQRMKQLLGRTIHQEIQRVRLNHVKERLLVPGMTIKQVARESGFASVQYMTRVFHAVTGETPAQYRNRRTK